MPFENRDERLAVRFARGEKSQHRAFILSEKSAASVRRAARSRPATSRVAIVRQGRAMPSVAVRRRMCRRGEANVMCAINRGVSEPRPARAHHFGGVTPLNHLKPRSRMSAGPSYSPRNTPLPTTHLHTGPSSQGRLQSQSRWVEGQGLSGQCRRAFSGSSSSRVWYRSWDPRPSPRSRSCWRRPIVQRSMNRVFSL